jgi:sec-independent protein translocase protein TatC
MDKDDKSSLLGIVQRLRKRLVACAIAVGIGFAISYAFSETLFKVLAWPLKINMAPEDRLIYTGLPEMFFIYIKVAFVAGIVLAAPFIFYEMWMLATPGFRQRQGRLVLPFVLLSSLLFIGGVLFGYFIAFPLGFKFFLGFENQHLQSLPSVKQYFSFSIRLLLLFGLIFELPVAVFFLAKVGIIKPEAMKKNRAYAMLGVFVLAAIVTPPDLISQVMLSIPLLALYEVAILIAKLAGSKKASKEESEQGEA